MIKMCPGGCGAEAYDDGNMCRPCLIGAQTLNRLRIEQLTKELAEAREGYYENLCDQTHEILWTNQRRGNVVELAQQIVTELAEAKKQRDEAIDNGLTIAGRLALAESRLLQIGENPKVISATQKLIQATRLGHTSDPCVACKSVDNALKELDQLLSTK